MHLLRGVHAHPIRVDEQQLSSENVANRRSHGGHGVINACKSKFIYLTAISNEMPSVQFVNES